MRVFLFSLLFAGLLFAEELPSEEWDGTTAENPPPELWVDAQVVALNLLPKKSIEDDGYTINYNTVSIIEYIRFASKICRVNFIYEESDLDFTVTIVSDEPVTPANVMATLIQVLRIHGLLLLEQDNNLVIHKSANVSQIAKLVTKAEDEQNAPIVTRIFRVRNAKPSSIAAIIQPMISSSAILETSPETSQLILTDITANVDKIAMLIENLDSPHSFLEIQSFNVINNAPDFLIDLASQIMNPIAAGNPFILVPQPLANEIYVVSTPELVQKALVVLASLDTSPKMAPKPKTEVEGVYVYKVLHRPGEEILKGLMHIGENLQESAMADPELIHTIESAKWIRETNSIMLIGTQSSVEKTKEFLASLDVSEGAGEDYSSKTSFFIYKPQYKSADDVRQALLEMADNLQGRADKGLLEVIENSKVNPLTQTLSFSGNEQYFPRIKQLLSTVDMDTGKKGLSTQNTQFLIYKPSYQSGEELFDALKDVQNELEAEKLSDPALLRALSSMKWVKSTNSLLFTGDPQSLEKIQSLIAAVDVQGSKQERTFIQYQPKYADAEKTESYVNQIAKNLAKKGGSKSLIETLRSYKWIPESKSFMFYGARPDLTEVQALLAAFDTPDVEAKAKSGYYIYKVQYTSGELIEDDLDNLGKNLKSSGIKNPNLLEVIQNIRYVKQTNSLLLSGDPKAIEEVKALIAQYDYPRTPTSSPASSNFFMYKPINLPAGQIQKSLVEVGENLKDAGLADPNLLKALDTAKYVSSTNTLIFTGTPDTLDKIKGLIKDVDLAPAMHAPIQHVGKTSFLLYKLKHADGSQIVSSIKNMTRELMRSGNADKNFLSALKSVRYVKETNSLFFAGDEASLEKVQGLVEQFDVTSLAPRPTEKKVLLPTSGTFFIYKPQSLKGPELESILEGFVEHLKSSGLNDPDLFQALDSMRFDNTTNTLVFTGNQTALDRVKDLLKEFDVPSNIAQDTIAPDTQSIQAIDNTSFLVYKLQFHKGDEIQNALRQIARDLIATNAEVNKGLLNSINSIQWLEVTNSLLCSGDQDTLTRLRELIKNLDIPLKQVFIEMLVIQTNLNNALQFGLEWGAKYKYRDKFGTASYNSDRITQGGSPSSFLQTLQSLNPGATPPQVPNPNNLPISSGFDLGIIGEVIRHNGQTFLTLGSLLSTLQTDDETSVIMTPKILTQDGRTSTIFVGDNIPFIGSFVQNAGASTINTANMEYRDIGLNLTITPVLGNSDIVTLDINLERSSAATDATGATIDFATQTAQGITTSKTTMQTTVHVPDNNFLILSGMVNNSNVKSKTGIPCLGGLPLVGAAFSRNNNTVNNTNIVIFIRPHIINSVHDMRGITTQEEDYFRDQQGSPFLEQVFDEGMELIKTIDDE
ncbi:MAG: hypothetical protein A3D96_04470 [Chlamydiae bacterium RIFCSPHIGHO2_12_FULL_44_59]|nr:MAG: hypothetical protein A2796_04245 [Chlamydiae bacterium RIFCSPHIGHO2_01_FULL_44_39]OGN60343.1 MAG: hypothetical protein A3D96_04470 [Chlamydiae bacterium RIFCSPHIGHO2_12_FULL_44_59]OGN70217.1 MAG: hypothetical protein A3F79_01060 [Chlamydiae bacterium RIFCSPLOWO2_12_FULL_45_20]